MKQSSKRLVSMILAFFLVIAALVILFDLIEPEYGTLESLKGEIIGQQNFLVSETAAVAKAQQIINEYANQSSTQENVALALPSGEDLAGALAQIYGLAVNNGVIVQNISISPPALQAQKQQAGTSTTALVKPIGSFLFQISTSGSYENMKNFLSGIETNVRIFDLKGFSLSENQTGAGGGAGVGGKTIIAPAGTQDFFTYQITVEVYYQAQ